MHGVEGIKRLIVGFMVLFLVTACGGPVVLNPVPVGAPGTNVTYPMEEYKIHVGDQIDVKFFYNPELNDSVTVRPDGRISLQLVHEIVAVGVTPGELSKHLSEKYAPELLNPEVAVIVRTFSTNKIYIDGEVNQPGAIDLTGPLTVMQSISSAGGLKTTARTDEIIVLRRGEGNRPMAIPVNITKAIDGTGMVQDITLIPYDIVYVPRSAIANLDLWMSQYIRDAIFVIPSEFFLYYSIIR